MFGSRQAGAWIAFDRVTWLFYGGFVIGRRGDLARTGVPEVWWLLVLVAAAACGWALGRLRHHW